MRILLLLTLLASCASQQDFNMPVHRLETPEVAGRTFGGGVDIGYTGSQKVVLNEIYPLFFTPNAAGVDSEKGMSQNGALALNARLGLGGYFEAVLRSRGDSPTMYGAKWQFAGKNTTQKGRGWKLGIAVLGGADTLDDADTIRFNSVDYDSEIKIKAG